MRERGRAERDREVCEYVCVGGGGGGGGGSELYSTEREEKTSWRSTYCVTSVHQLDNFRF